MRLRALLLLPLLTGLSLVAIMAQTPVTLQPGVSGEREAAKKKGIALLLDLREAIAQIKSPHTRINNQLMAANLRNGLPQVDRKSTRLNSSHSSISYAVFCLKKKNKQIKKTYILHT